MIEKTLTREKTLALIAACDGVVTLHRSEGLGLLVAEAMVLGKPAIATDYSGTTELVTPDTGWPVDYSLTLPSGDALELIPPFIEDYRGASPLSSGLSGFGLKSPMTAWIVFGSLRALHELSQSLRSLAD